MLKQALIITKREMMDSLRDWRIVTPILILTLVFPWIMSAASRIAAEFAVDYGVSDNAAVIIQQLVPFSLLIVGFFPISFSLVIALETFVGERERNTLEPLLATPISDTELYLGKLLAAMLLPLGASYLGIVFHILGLFLTTDYQVSFLALSQVMLLNTMTALVMVAGAVVVSSHTTSVRAANLLASFIIVPVALFLQGEAVLLFWRRYDVIWLTILAFLVVNLAFVRTGMRLFNREEILAREYDEISLRGLWRSFQRFWSASPTEERQRAPLTLSRLYREHLPSLFRLHRATFLVVLLVIVGGFGLGWLLAWRYPLPSSLGWEQLQGLEGEGWASLQLLPEINFMSIFLHNMRATLIAAFLAVVSFGAAPLILLLIPMGMVGFLAGEAANFSYSPLSLLLGFVLPHGVVEVPATWIATAFALQIGASFMAPTAGLSLGEGVLRAVVNYLKVLIFLVVPLFLIAAVIEAKITPQVALWVLSTH